jgi:ribonuclease HI
MSQLTIYTQGMVEGEQGDAIVKALVLDADENEVLTLNEAIGNATREYAEYFAVVRALQALADTLGDKVKTSTCVLKSQDEQLIKHLKAQAEITDVSLIGHFIEIYNLRVRYFPALDPQLITPQANLLTK